MRKLKRKNILTYFNLGGNFIALKMTNPIGTMWKRKKKGIRMEGGSWFRCAGAQENLDESYFLVFYDSYSLVIVDRFATIMVFRKIKRMKNESFLCLMIKSRLCLCSNHFLFPYIHRMTLFSSGFMLRSAWLHNRSLNGIQFTSTL